MGEYVNQFNFAKDEGRLYQALSQQILFHEKTLSFGDGFQCELAIECDAILSEDPILPSLHRDQQWRFSTFSLSHEHAHVKRWRERRLSNENTMQ